MTKIKWEMWDNPSWEASNIKGLAKSNRRLLAIHQGNGNLQETAYRKIPLLVEATIEADITIAPQIVSLGVMTPGKEVTVNVVIRGKKPFAVEKIECESDLEAFKVRLPKTTKPVHILPLTVVPPNTPGVFSEEFTVTIAGRPEPLTFKAYGKISGTVIK